MKQRLYGVRNLAIDRARELLEERLEIKMEAAESLYLGPYYRCIAGSHSLKLRLNTDPLWIPGADHVNEKYAYPEFRNYSLLVAIESSGGVEPELTLGSPFEELVGRS